MSVSTSSPEAGRPARFDPGLIEKEIEHLKKRQGVRDTRQTKRAKGKVVLVLSVLAVLWLYTMDVFFFSYHRGDAARVYLYLHNYGNEAKAKELANCGYFTKYELTRLDQRTGSFQDYCAGPIPAAKQADELIAYMSEVRALHEGKYDSLSLVNKARYFLFIKTGLIPPISWQVLNSSIDK